MAPDAERQVSAPSAIAVAQNAAPELGPSVTLGSDVDGPATLYLRFPALSPGRDLRFAWLVLEARDSTYLARALTLEVGRARGPFSSGGLTPEAQPGLTSPVVEHRVQAGTTSPIRVDVTKLLQHFVTHSGHEPLLAVRARDAFGAGLTLNTGTDGGRAPRLDTYWRE